MYSHISIIVDGKKCHVVVPYDYNLAVKPSEVIKYIRLLEDYVRDHTDKEIELYNQKKKSETEEYYLNLLKQGNKPKSKPKKGFVYLFECGGRYKVGYSANADKRFKQLDTRPFKLNEITKVYSDCAYDIEQSLHGNLFKYRVEGTGEWYDFDFEITPEIFEKWVREIEGRLKE